MLRGEGGLVLPVFPGMTPHKYDAPGGFYRYDGIMQPLALHEFHRQIKANLAELDGAEIVADYGGELSEYLALKQGAGVLDLSFRGRICLTGADRSGSCTGR